MAHTDPRDRPESKPGVPQIEVTPEMIEAGIALDAYPKGIPMMAFRDPNQFFLTL
jgi:hypothetical protein